jgi:hypothetical protein
MFSFAMWRRRMSNNHGLLTERELDQVSGGDPSGYHFCWDGKAGTGLYPLYVDCGLPRNVLGVAILDAISRVNAAAHGK